MTGIKEDKNEQLDYLATCYSRTKSEEDLTLLIKEMIPICKRDARSWSLRTGLPEADLFSVYLESVQEAAKGYKPIGLFIKRYHHFKNKKGADVLRYYGYKKRDMFKTLSLNTPLNEQDGEEYTEFIDMIPDYSSEFSKVIELKDLIQKFKQKNPYDATIIEMLASGKENKDIAVAIGQTKYDDFARKKVSVARKTFKKFIQ